jgi:hypothetical protein
MDLNKVKEYLKENDKAPKVLEQDYFKLAICEVILGNFPQAKELFGESIVAMFGANPFWLASSQPNWLVDIVILSGRSDLYSSVAEELMKYKMSSKRSHPVGDSPLAHYCYCAMEILSPNSGNITAWINVLTKRPKFKDLYAAGLAFQAIQNRDKLAFNKALQLLLIAHEGIAKHGELRLTPEGWLCLPAMTISYLGYRNGLNAEIENDYLSREYLYFLINMNQ